LGPARSDSILFLGQAGVADELCRRAFVASDGQGRASGFADALLLDEDITVRVNDLEIAQIPEAGATIVVANHPHGILDGLALASLLLAIGKEVRFLATGMLQDIRGIGELASRNSFKFKVSVTTRKRSGLRPGVSQVELLKLHDEDYLVASGDTAVDIPQKVHRQRF
jgi:hypothetical protein